MSSTQRRAQRTGVLALETDFLGVLWAKGCLAASPEALLAADWLLPDTGQRFPGIPFRFSHIPEIPLEGTLFAPRSPNLLTIGGTKS
ncbi:MAG TPA: hypothetical protein VFB38_17015 [Chthonomonadaceae bacterium]|nr:hypothetical protein [Chthonomonadaceae bacterium]